MIENQGLTLHIHPSHGILKIILLHEFKWLPESKINIIYFGSEEHDTVVSEVELNLNSALESNIECLLHLLEFVPLTIIEVFVSSNLLNV